MRKSGLLFITVLAMALSVLCSCGNADSDVPVFYIKNGTEAYDPAKEMIDNFYSTFYDGSEADEPRGSETSEPAASESVSETVGVVVSPSTGDEVSGTVYWVKSGEVWHTTDKCSSLSRSKNIFSGSIEDAMLTGKSRACKKCGT